MNWEVDFFEWMKNRAHLDQLYGTDEQVLARAIKDLKTQVSMLGQRLSMLEIAVGQLEEKE